MWKDKLKKFWNEHPVETVIIGIAALTAASRFIDASSAAQGRRAYARQVDYRVSNKM